MARLGQNTHHHQHQPQGFGLVELLVVMALMSVMLSLLLPAVRQARETGSTLSCQMQQRRLAEAFMRWGTDHRGWLPSGPIESGFWFDDVDRGSPIELYDATRSAQGLSGSDGWYGQGLLWLRGYVTEPVLFYCPRRAQQGWGLGNAWPRRWNGWQPDDGKTRIFTSYAYRGGLASQGDGPWGRLNLHRLPPGSAVLADNPMYGARWHEQGHNIALIDGRVQGVRPELPMIDGRLQHYWPRVQSLLAGRTPQ